MRIAQHGATKPNSIASRRNNQISTALHFKTKFLKIKKHEKLQTRVTFYN